MGVSSSRSSLDLLGRRLGVVSMDRLNRAFSRARNDLAAVGLLAQGKYLDRIECVRAWLPSLGEVGYVFDGGTPWYLDLVGYEPGVIYLPLNAPVTTTPGDTLVDTVRHEFGHAWAWLDRPLINRRWFRRAFGARYHDEWEEPPRYDPAEYVSPYACTRPAEDFCETFATYLRCRRSLHRFEHRPGVKRKLAAVAYAVSIAATERAPRVSGLSAHRVFGQHVDGQTGAPSALLDLSARRLRRRGDPYPYLRAVESDVLRLP